MSRKKGAKGPRLWTEDNRRIILDTIRETGAIKTAYQLAGISHDTFERWRSRDALFALDIERNRALAKKLLIHKVTEKDPWKILKNVGRDEFQENIEHHIDSNHTLTVISENDSKTEIDL